MDLDTSRQRYDNSDGQLGSLTGGYDKTLRYERNKVTLGHDTALTFGTWKSSLNWNETENKGRQLVSSALTPDQAWRAGDDRELKNTNVILNSVLLAGRITFTDGGWRILGRTNERWRRSGQFR